MRRPTMFTCALASGIALMLLTVGAMADDDNETDFGLFIAHQKPVTVGPLVGNDYVVLGGLKAGDKVIVAGIQKIGDGVPVMAAPARGGEPAAKGEAK